MNTCVTKRSKLPNARDRDLLDERADISCVKVK